MPCSIRRIFLYATLLLAAFGLSACTGFNSDVTDAGTTDASLSWPDIEDYTADGGTSPALDDLRLVTNGTTKDQVYDLLDVPHRGEGLTWMVSEWNYLFYLPSGDDEVACQYKILFDEDRQARSFYWKPASCEAILQPAESAPEPVEPVEPPVVQPDVQPEPTTSTLSSSVLFGFDEATLSNKGQDVIAGVAERLQQSEDTVIEIVGYTDRIGSEAYNRTLSQNRANAVRDALVSQGINPRQVDAVGKGVQEPVVKCAGRGDTVIACLAPNRRVEIDADGTF